MTYMILRQVGVWADKAAQDTGNNKEYRGALLRLAKAIQEILPYW